MAADEGDHGLATDGSANAKPGLSGTADSGPPGWASADQARSWCHAANLASRLQCHDVSSAQLWLVLDGIFPHGWEHEEAMATLDSENARTLLLELCRVGSLTATILSLADGLSFTRRGTAAQQATDAGSIHLGRSPQVRVESRRREQFNPHEFVGEVPQRLAEATGNTSAADLDSLCEMDSRRREQFNPHESVGEVRQRLAEATGNRSAADLDSLCEKCQQQPAAWELGGVECWECYGEH